MVDKLRFHDVLTAGGLADQPSRDFGDALEDELSVLATKEDMARFEQRMEDRFAAADRLMEARFAAQDRRIDERFTAQERYIDQRFAAQERLIDERFAAQERFIDQRFAAAREHSDQQSETNREYIDKQIWRAVGVVSLVILGVGGVVVGAIAAFAG